MDMDFRDEFATSAGYRTMIDHVVGPLRSGAGDYPVTLDDTGQARVDWRSRLGVLLAAPRAGLEVESLRLSLALRDDGGVLHAQPDVTFAPFTEAGAFLPVYRPPTDAQLQTAEPFTVQLQAVRLRAGQPDMPIDAAALAETFELRLIEGNVAKTAYLLGAEKQQIRRLAREIRAMRQLATARDDALDRMGAELGVQRFLETLAYQPPAGGVGFGAIVTHAERESDADYRQRLAIYRSFNLATYHTVSRLLNGVGADGDANAGLMGGVGVQERFQIIETDNEFSVAVHLHCTDDALRADFSRYLRSVFLIHPLDPNVHDARFLPAAKKDELHRLCGRLTQFYQFQNEMAIAPALAAALDRLGRCRKALGFGDAIDILRAQDVDGGSRYELGLGVDIAALPPDALDQLAEAREQWQPDGVDAEIDALLPMATAQPAEADPEGRWLLQACGLLTVHRVDAGTVYLSHMPTSGLVIDVTSQQQPDKPTDLSAYYHAPGDPGSNVVLVSGLSSAARLWADAGGAPWDVLATAKARQEWEQLQAYPAGMADVLRAAGLNVAPDPARLAEPLARVPDELLDTLAVDAALSQAIVAGSEAAVEPLRALVNILRGQNIVALLPLVTATNQVLIVVGVVGLPQVGINLNARRAVGFRWYAVPIKAGGGTLQPVGSRSQFVPGRAGVTALVVIGYVRRGLTDPYEYRVELPPNARLSLLQYEYLMNLLDHSYPLGVQVNTFEIRQEHVDLDGDGSSEALPPGIFRTFRPFRRPRSFGQTASED